MPTYKSKFEATVAAQLGLDETYETNKLSYKVPESYHRYTPDFAINEFLVIETKGKFTAEDRYKMYLLKEQYPLVNFVLYFQNASVSIRKGSKTSYRIWAEKNGFTWYCYKKKPLTVRELNRLIKESLKNANHEGD